jgi:hypothetical protein
MHGRARHATSATVVASSRADTWSRISLNTFSSDFSFSIGVGS